MKAKIIFIEVEESRLAKSKIGNAIHTFNYLIRENTKIQPIKPVLVGEGEVREGDQFLYDGNRYVCKRYDADTGFVVSKENYGEPVEHCAKVLTQDTKELYEDIASGELVEGVWYEFESHKMEQLTGLNASKIVDELATPLKVVRE